MTTQDLDELNRLRRYAFTAGATMADQTKYEILLAAHAGPLIDAARIAHELAAKCVRGNNACTACGACAYLGSFSHNAGCPVLRLQAIKE